MGRVSLTAQHQLAAVPDPAGLEIPVLQRDPLPLEAGLQLRPAPVQKAGAPHRPGGLQKDPEAVEVPQGGVEGVTPSTSTRGAGERDTGGPYAPVWQR